MIFIAWLLVIVDAAFIFWLSSMSRPLPFLPDLQKYQFDKLLHVIEYGLFGWLLIRALFLSFPKKPFKILVTAAFFLGLFYGLSDEWHQSFVPARNSSLWDLAADATGVFFGITLWLKQKFFFSCLK